MQVSAWRRLAIAWAVLASMTLLSWWIGVKQAHGFALNAAVTLSVILMAAIKVRVIVREFMDVGHAPVLLRRLIDAWLALLVAALIAAYFFGGRLWA